MGNTLVWAMAASTVAVTVETLFRQGWVWHERLWLFIPAAVLLNYCIYRTVVSGPTLILAIAGFSLITLLARAGVSHFILDEPVARGNLAAAGCMAVGIIVGAAWR